MIANDLEPKYPTHPGSVLKDEIEYRGISERKLANSMGVSTSLLNEVLNEKRAINSEFALMIGMALDIDAEPLLIMQMRYDLFMAKKNQSFLLRLGKVKRVASIL